MTSTPEYWCAESLVVTVNGPQGRSTAVIGKPYARIGSHPRSEVVLSGLGIEPRSLYLHATGEGVFCVRLQAAEGGVIGAGSWLNQDETLRVGPYELFVHLQREVTGPVPQVGLTAWGSAPPPLPVCEISSDEKVIDKRRFRARLNLVGRRRELALQMLGQQVSSCHCALFWDSGKLWCIDLLSSNGTLLDGQPIDCAVCEINSSLFIGEFSLQFKRLSQSTPRQSSWRTGESDEDTPLPSAAGSRADSPADLLAQTVSVATGDTGDAEETGEAAPAHVKAFPAPDLQPQDLPGNDLIVPPRAEQQANQLQKKLSQSSQQLIAQRRQLDQQWTRANEEVAAQVSFLQTESALLAAQRQEMARLRAEFEMRRRALTEDLLALQQESPQRQIPTDLRPHPALDNHSDRPQEFNLVAHRAADNEDPSESEASPESAGSAEQQASADAGLYAPSSSLNARTIIEASYVVEKETSGAWQSPPANLPARSPSGPPADTDLGLSRPASSNAPNRALTNPAAVSPAAAASDSVAPRVMGRSGRVEPDQLGDFVADRLTLRDAPRHFWLRVLWGVAALASMAALAALVYVALRNS